MSSTSSRIRIAVAGGVLAVGASAALLVPGIAAAAPGGPGGPGHLLAETTCSFAQVDAALHAAAPELAARLDANPERKAKLEQLLNLPPEQRKAAIQQRLDDPKVKERIEEHRGKIEERRNDPRFTEMRDKMQTVADTCHNY
ncbi:hemophore-related protein [Nocardia sp. NPDC057440]|uniref:hemophore-related protein n=1 Tax=Nocardia sp. NPDC057440 TaxID=3346134 RepID=UPI003670C5E5